MEAQDVLDFWFAEIDSKYWFAKNNDLDKIIHDRFSELYKSAAKGELFTWRKDAFGRLAEILLLDQFPRNIFRSQPQAFQTDPMALLLAEEMVILGEDKKLPIEMRPFAYMPFMHSESRIIHEEAVKLFSHPGMEEGLAYEMDHKKIIDQFGRFPHRNGILHRLSTLKELEFMQTHKGN